ncbi:hypothetical protein BaRGS_00035419, partial [Batillaria attramentaria]
MDPGANSAGGCTDGARAQGFSRVQPGAETRRSNPDPSEHLVLRSALQSMRSLLGQLGLQPCRVLCFMRQKPDFRQFPDTARLHLLFDLERQDVSGCYEAAAAAFVDEYLLDENAPPGILPHFMSSLLEANADELHSNQGAWHVHDVLILACVYMPVQRALCSVYKERRSCSHLQLVAPMLNMLGYITRPDLTAVQELLECGESEAAVVRMLAALYAKQADVLQEQERALDDPVLEVFAESAGTTHKPPAWLDTLLYLVDQNGGRGIRHLIQPSSILSSETWSAACDDTRSEGGDSVSSDKTAIPYDHPDEETNSVDLTLPRSRDEEENRRRRTDDFVYSGLLNIKAYEKECASGGPVDLFLDERLDTVLDSNFLQQERYLTFAEDQPLKDKDETSSVSTEDNCGVGEDEMNTTRKSQGVTVHLEHDQNDHVILRPYQEKLLHPAREGKNVMIMLPTGTGKTYVVLKYVQEFLSKNKRARVVFLAPKIKLAEQQYHRFEHYFPASTYFRCGRSRSSDEPFSQLLDTHRVFVLTPQCLVEAIQANEVLITDFSLIVLDECHHAIRKHPYKVLMDHYMNAKFGTESKESHLPQVIGLTASPGVGPAGNVEEAVDHLRELCSNMNIEQMCTVENKSELMEMHMCKRRAKDGFRHVVESLMTSIEERMVMCPYVENYVDKEGLRTCLTAPASCRGLLSYTHWANALHSKLVDFVQDTETYKMLFSSTEMLLMYQRALILNEDCESQYALNYLQDQIREMEEAESVGDTDRQMTAEFKDQFQNLNAACNDPEDYNPKLAKLENILCRLMDKYQDKVACMVFVRTLELSRAIQQWMEGHHELKQLNPGRITGNRKPVSDGGMSRNALAEVMHDFNTGKHKIVVCTSAAEEGLDFQSCNIVIRYDYVTSMVSMVQTR